MLCSQICNIDTSLAFALLIDAHAPHSLTNPHIMSFAVVSLTPHRVLGATPCSHVPEYVPAAPSRAQMFDCTQSITLESHLAVCSESRTVLVIMESALTECSESLTVLVIMESALTECSESLTVLVMMESTLAECSESLTVLVMMESTLAECSSSWGQLSQTARSHSQCSLPHRGWACLRASSERLSRITRDYCLWATGTSRASALCIEVRAHRAPPRAVSSQLMLSTDRSVSSTRLLFA